MTEAYDKLAARVVMILQRFNDGERLTVEELAEEFGVSVRTIQRDLNRFSFLPIEKEDGRYYLASYALGKLRFEDIKTFSHISGIGDLYPKLDARMITDILNPDTAKTMKIKGNSYEDLSEIIEIFDMLGGAVLSHLKVSFVYKDKKRTVLPYRLFNTNGVWYLVGVEEGVIKHFTLSKIAEVCVLKEHFMCDVYIEDTIERSSMTWISQKPLSIILRIDAVVAEHFERRAILSEQKIVEIEESGTLIVETKVAFEEEILRTVRYWIPHIIILSPEYLQCSLEEGLRGYLGDGCKS